MDATAVLECGRCELVNLYGLMQLCEFYPTKNILPDEGGVPSQYLADIVARQHDRMTVYMATQHMRRFVSRTLPEIRSTFVLVTGCCDMTTPAEALTRPQLRRLLASPLLIKWYAQNLVSVEPKIAHWPIGIHWPIGRGLVPGAPLSPLESEALFLSVRAAAPAVRIPLIYSRLTMRNDRFSDRWAALDNIPAELFAGGADYVASAGSAKPTPMLEFWRGLGAHAFCLSPFGIGLDCYRTWEALAMGAIPIVRRGSRGPFDRLYEGLPVLAVSEWRDVTRELLDRTLREFGARFDFNSLDKIRLSYWRNLLEQT